MKDIIIIGGGPIGMACGLACEKRDLDYYIIEKGVLVNSIFNYPLNMTFFSTSDRLEIGQIPFISQQNKPTRTEALEYYRKVAILKNLKVKLYEEVSEIKKHKNYFNVKTLKGQYKSKNIVIATGFYDSPYLLNVPGETLTKVRHYYSEPHPFFGMDLIIVGGANSAVDAALENYRKGAKSVTLVIRENSISKNVKYWVRPDIVNRIKDGEIKAYFNSNIIEIKEKEVLIKTPKGKKKIKNDFVLAMTGYKPNFNMLTSLGVTYKKDQYKTPVYNKKTMESKVEGLYLAGVVCGGLKTNKWFIENSREHGRKIIDSVYKNLVK
ncbi:MAG: hypothetical protein CMC79_01665 [Flavobacteriaceae bacterium]|nr:hypothetical protein [Flavobacteriaceae bacterium]|tara:strand:- start:28940 stop:29908 length:969 start_codon:yes stop_codon:yes gene_type:complete